VVSGGRADVKRRRGAQVNADLFRLRVGDHRIVFAVVGDEIRVTRIIHRSEGYDWL
jgi:mRNA-degrading endonuclease RelE of RelBE toxin-antitoxin system